MPIPAASPALYEPAPPQVTDDISQSFMLEDLARSGLVPEDLAAYPIANVFGVGQYVIPYQVPHMWVRRIISKSDMHVLRTKNGATVASNGHD